MTDDEIVYLITAHYATSGEINDVIIFARAIESRTLTKQKARWYQEGLVAGLRQALAESPKREWVELTDEDIEEAVGSPLDEVYLADFRKVEARLKEKNNA